MTAAERIAGESIVDELWGLLRGIDITTEERLQWTRRVLELRAALGLPPRPRSVQLGRLRLVVRDDAIADDLTIPAGVDDPIGVA